MGGYLWAELYREVGRGHSRRQKHHEKTQGNDTMWHAQTIARSLLKWENIKQERKLEEQGAQWSRASEDILKSLNLGYGQWGALCEEESMLDLWSRVGVQFAVWRTEWMVAKPKARRQIRIKWENNRELYGGTPPTLFWRGYIGRDGKQAEKSICSTALPTKNWILTSVWSSQYVIVPTFRKKLKEEKRIVRVGRRNRKTREGIFELLDEVIMLWQKMDQEASPPPYQVPW